jgi:hypothetical protein
MISFCFSWGLHSSFQKYSSRPCASWIDAPKKESATNLPPHPDNLHWAVLQVHKLMIGLKVQACYSCQIANICWVMILRSISVPKWLLTLDSCISPSTGRNHKAVCQMTECIQEHYSSSTCQSINHKVLANGKLFLPSKRSNLPVIGSASVSLCLHTPWVKSSVNMGVRKRKGLECPWQFEN